MTNKLPFSIHQLPVSIISLFGEMQLAPIMILQPCGNDMAVSFTTRNMCFINNFIPSVWRKAIIAPIPKSSTKDPCVPLNYRGISLLSCVYKMYSSLLNIRITAHCEDNGYIVDEQNGFRSKRSCQDHIYVLSTVIRNRKSKGLSTYCAYCIY